MAKTRDHTVPRMYLKRWAVLRRQAHHLRAAPVTDLDRAFSTVTTSIAAEGDFYRGTTPEGVGNHDMEKFLTKVENEATPAFRKLLDCGKLPQDNAFPDRWPPQDDHRLAIAWWLASQILRTDHQRRRLWRQLGASSDAAGAPSVNDHLAYIAEMVSPLAAALYRRPWGFGWSDSCLLTSDTPAILLNGQDADAQLLAASFWDVYLPLDPHRFLFLPGASHTGNPRLRRDHLLKLDGGQGIALNHIVLDAAVRHVFWHEDHDPTRTPALRRAPHPAEAMPRYLLSYDALAPGFGVQRRWLNEHSAPTTGAQQTKPLSDDDALMIVEQLTARLDRTQAVWDTLSSM
ncbi:DUF4238 domain-containing protein [Nocardia gipuzkoensis]